MVLEVTDPDARIVVVTADADRSASTTAPRPPARCAVAADAVALLEMLSTRDAGAPGPRRGRGG